MATDQTVSHGTWVFQLTPKATSCAITAPSSVNAAFAHHGTVLMALRTQISALSATSVLRLRE